MATPGRVDGSNRVEACSDGVFAIAITLLVLDLRAPEEASTFVSDLVGQWPSSLAFVSAFAVLGLIWRSALLGTAFAVGFASPSPPSY